MTENSKIITRSLLGRGYFPKELPSAFTTTDFSEHALDILDDWERDGLFKVKGPDGFRKIDGKRFRGRYTYNKMSHAEAEVISKPKKLYERRNIHITHPIPQALLAREIAMHWRPLMRILARRKYSEDEIVISDQYERSIKGINFPLHRAKTAYIEATANWLVATDISRFYPSIYTHSIPWAAYGKERVKENMSYYEGSFADRLDVLVRSCNRNQTVGLPVGPETSRILAEIVSSRIDSAFSTGLPRGFSGLVDRLQDDWVVGASTLEEAEKVLSLISSCYRDYGLEINGSKTSITHILSSNRENWKSEISAFLSHRSGALHGARLEGFLDMCLRLQLTYGNEPVINYALAIVEGRKYSNDDAQLLESFLLKAAAIYPGSMDRVCRVVLNIEYQTGGLSRERVAGRFVELAERHFENGALFEVIWLLYTLRGLKKPFRSPRIMEYAKDVPSSAIRLLILDMRKKGIFLSTPPLSSWEEEVSKDRITSDWSWLYAYEAIRKGWMADRCGLLATPFFKAMHDRNVVFFDPSKNVKSSKSVKTAQFEVRKRQNVEVSAFLRFLRGLPEQALPDQTVFDLDEYS